MGKKIRKTQQISSIQIENPDQKSHGNKYLRSHGKTLARCCPSHQYHQIKHAGKWRQLDLIPLKNTMPQAVWLLVMHYVQAYLLEGDLRNGVYHDWCACYSFRFGLPPLHTGRRPGFFISSNRHVNRQHPSMPVTRKRTVMLKIVKCLPWIHPPIAMAEGYVERVIVVRNLSKPAFSELPKPTHFPCQYILLACALGSIFYLRFSGLFRSG
ncbi:hypothetical protein V6N11_026826 [Hibiscus sabdariffa]|uniref:Uncharacterized protein n=1 Tax=Hibiscus sabdariffa TaxID=183260 RepID=A0ABR2SXP0_9ROSI